MTVEDYQKLKKEAYSKFFRQDNQFKHRCFRIKDNYIFSKGEAYDAIDYYLRTGVEP